MANKTIDKALLARKIQGLDGLSKEEKSALTELINRREYGLVWEDKPEDVEEQLKIQMPYLKEVAEKRIISDEPDAPNHIIIEGDNLSGLASLAYAYAGKINLIYIDPPYNTGNNDFVYNDRFVDKEDSYRHSKWLSFMKKRLKIAHKLLSDDGVIFISIDDNEQAPLKLLCDSIFSESNFVGTYFWKRTETPPALSYKIRKKFEYVLCYQKTEVPKRTFAQGLVDGGDAPLLNSGNPIGTLRFPVGSVHFNIPDGTYTHTAAKKIHLLDPVVVVNGVNACEFSATATFKWGQNNLDNEVANGTFFVIKSNQFSIRYQKSERATKVPSNIIDSEVTVGTNEEAKKELENLNLASNFDYAKPSSLIAYLIRMPFWEKNDITVLDFFAGSGTTMDATIQLNNLDQGTRKCILLNNNEGGICEQITYERCRKAISGYAKKSGEIVSGATNNNLRYYKTEFLDRIPSYKNKRKLVSVSTDLLCIKEDLYDEKENFGSITLDKRRARYFEHGNKRMLVICDETLLYDFIAEIREMQFDGKIKVYVFSDSAYAYEDDFAEVIDKVEPCALPAAILAAYKDVLPERAEQDVDGNFVGVDLHPVDDEVAAEDSAPVEEDSSDSSEEPYKPTLF